MTPVDVVRTIYDAMAARDIEQLFGLLHPDIVVTQDEALPWGGRHEGHRGFAEFGLTLRGVIDSAVTIDAIFEADDEVLQMGRTKGTVLANGAEFDIPEVHRWKIVDGRAARVHFAIDTAAMLRAIAGSDQPDGSTPG